MNKIEHDGKLLAIVVPHDYHAEGIQFFTPGDFSQQLAYMHHPAGHEIIPHYHNHLERKVHYTQEVLILRKGRLRVNFYDEQQRFIKSIELSSGDIILLAGGGHGFDVLEELEMLEVKQGPYLGELDKTRFMPEK